MGDRRARVRAATMAEIRATARQLLVGKGTAAVTINAIGRQMGMSGPAVYRYYASHDELVGAVVAEIYHDVTVHLEQKSEELTELSPGLRLQELSRALRAWAIAHPAEFTWAFTQGASSINAPVGDELRQAGEHFESVFRSEVESLWAQHQFSTRPVDEFHPPYLAQLEEYVDRSRTSLPAPAAEVFLACWTRIYGMVIMDLLGQLRFAYTDASMAFEAVIEELCDRLDITYRPLGQVT